MKPVVVVHSSVVGGAESYLNRLYGNLSDQGISATLIGTNPGWETTGLPRVPLALSAKWSGKTILTGALKVPLERALLCRAVRQEAPDFFHLQFKREQIAFTSTLARFAPVVWTEHGRFLRGPKGALLARAYKEAARWVAAIICVSDDVASDLRRIVGPRVRLEVIENAVDTDRMRPPTPSEKALARTQLSLSCSDRVLLWIGRLHRDKRPEYAVELGKLWPGVTLIAGDGDERAAVELAAAGAPNVRVLGHVTNTEVLYRAADVVAFTSAPESGEGFPTMTMIEAAAHGVPIVTDEASGAGELVRRMGCEPVPSSANASQWIAHLLSITKQHSSDARAWSLEHDIRRWAASHRAVFDSILGSKDANDEK